MDPRRRGDGDDLPLENPDETPSETSGELTPTLPIEPATPADEEAHRPPPHLASLGMVGNSPPMANAPGQGGRGPLPEWIGPYRVLEQVGVGAFGVVYRAEQRGKLARTVAVKVIKKGMDSNQVLARFDAEKNALSMMNHPNIAGVLDSGETQQGQPYFVMEYVGGKPLTEFCDREKMTIKERLVLFQQVCRGVQHAHSKGIIHRDLKPANILVTRESATGNSDRAEPRVKIIDFGLAKALSGGLTEHTMVSITDAPVGTPEYMSPEQMGSGGSDVDTQTDIYSLGVVLYELLVGVRPFRFRRGKESIEKFKERITTDDPPRPSLQLGELGQEEAEKVLASRGRGTTKEWLRRELRSELDWIALMALKNRREERYPTPLAFAEDVERYLSRREPVIARPDSVGYRLRKLGRKYRGALTTVGLLFLTLSGVSGWALEGWSVAKEAKEKAEKENLRFNYLADLQRALDLKEARANLLLSSASGAEEMRRWVQDVNDLLSRRENHRTFLEKTSEDLEALRREDSPNVAQGQERRVLEYLEGEVLPELVRLGEDSGLSKLRDEVEELLLRREEALEDPLWNAVMSEIPAIRRPDPCLIPLGKNEQGLWEFWCFQSGERPKALTGNEPGVEDWPVTQWARDTGADSSGERAARSKWRIEAETGMVFVLIPAGRVSPEEPTVVPAGYISKYEMTKAQWQRLSGEKETSEGAGSLTVPAEKVSWQGATEAYPTWGLAHPTPGFWERAARGETETTWWTGKEEEDARDGGNFKSVVVVTTSVSNVGQYRANPFGLHDTIGNVWEWCTAEADEEQGRRTLVRGGGYRHPAFFARSEARPAREPDAREAGVGLRPARAIAD